METKNAPFGAFLRDMTGGAMSHKFMRPRAGVAKFASDGEQICVTMSTLNMLATGEREKSPQESPNYFFLPKPFRISFSREARIAFTTLSGGGFWGGKRTVPVEVS
jgi:hypothetical protein